MSNEQPKTESQVQFLQDLNGILKLQKEMKSNQWTCGLTLLKIINPASSQLTRKEVSNPFCLELLLSSKTYEEQFKTKPASDDDLTFILTDDVVRSYEGIYLSIIGLDSVKRATQGTNYLWAELPRGSSTRAEESFKKWSPKDTKNLVSGCRFYGLLILAGSEMSETCKHHTMAFDITGIFAGSMLDYFIKIISDADLSSGKAVKLLVGSHYDYRKMGRAGGKTLDASLLMKDKQYTSTSLYMPLFKIPVVQKVAKECLDRSIACRELRKKQNEEEFSNTK